jgi:hypothetical protein
VAVRAPVSDDLFGGSAGRPDDRDCRLAVPGREANWVGDPVTGATTSFDRSIYGRSASAAFRPNDYANSLRLRLIG